MEKSFNPEREITRMWQAIHGAQDEQKRTFFQWRETALEFAPDADPLELTLKASEIRGLDAGKALLPRYNWTKGGLEGFIKQVAGAFAGLFSTEGAAVKVENGENSREIFVVWERCPWPSFFAKYDVPMEEDYKGCDKYLQTILDLANAFMNTNLKMESQKYISRADGKCVRRIYAAE